ncbi:hypothetical protein GGX14DRAFT_527446 [Mycena pura]|uniref:Uncharacterized protein n=1 Tax=Mycena pura TaxID=153505 RepID=A0AAD6UU22_9AGAR|nr:hypothetical protein GGX14DRAFT_527446 [Mycena pura]
MNYIEQDRGRPNGDDALPTYDDLAAQQGPNSRFGRWRGWIEKRAAERLDNITPEERERRRARGWGNDEMDELDPEPPTPTVADNRLSGLSGLSIQTNNLRISTLSEPPESPPLPPLPPVSTRLRPTHLKMNHFGSRFLPHSTSPIRCVLPLEAERLLLIGHDEGLSVLDLFPQDWNEAGGIDLKGPKDAKVHAIWEGERVYQMSILELDQTSGVVLMLVGPESETPVGKESEGQRAVRMYNFASLLSLAKWAVVRRDANPLNLGDSALQQTTPKRHRPTNSIARGLKSLIPPNNQAEQSYQAMLSPSPSVSGARTPPKREHSDDSPRSAWEPVDDLAFRWARDFVPLAAAGSRLLNLSILSFALWKKEQGIGQFLAVATKSSILLYETPPNERAFRYVKEFYTPLQPKAISFFQQSVHDNASSPTDLSQHRRSSSFAPGMRIGGRRAAPSPFYGTQLSIFVVFEKKASWIRVADSAVGEMEPIAIDDAHLALPGAHARGASATGSVRRRHHVAGADAHAHAGGWLPPVRAELPTRSVYLLTHGATTHVVPCPLPSQTAAVARLAAVSWREPPSHVAPRVGPACLQLTALGEGSVEVQELPLAALGPAGTGTGKGKGKGRAVAVDADLTFGPVQARAEEDAGGHTGFLCMGGHWDASHTGMYPGSALLRSRSTQSFSSVDSEENIEVLRREQGLYGWCRKGLSDWRVFWLGGSFADEPEDGEGL